MMNPVVKVFAENKKDNMILQDAGRWMPSTCQGCTTWCPIEIFVVNGRPIKVRGSQNSNVNPGYVCPRGHLIIRQHFDPDRLKVPMKRTNPEKGRGVNPNFVPITWDEALNTIADKIMELRTAGEIHKYSVHNTQRWKLYFYAIQFCWSSYSNFTARRFC